MHLYNALNYLLIVFDSICSVFGSVTLPTGRQAFRLVIINTDCFRNGYELLQIVALCYTFL